MPTYDGNKTEVKTKVNRGWRDEDVGKTQAEILLCIKKKGNSDKGYNPEKKT